jgi:diadenosine tetraphosphate (Ap4A) HIT family hydrolase
MKSQGLIIKKTSEVFIMEFMKKFNPEKNTIKEFNYWVVLLREKQVTLGATVIVLKREVSSLAQLTKEEAIEFPKVVSWFEKLGTSLYGAEKFNYVVAMMKDNFVHYHAFPRYGTVLTKYGVEWKDQNWPKVIEFLEVSYEDSVLDEIKKDMRVFE